MSVQKMKEYATDPAKLLNEASETLKSATKGTPVEDGLVMLKKETGVDEGMLAFAISVALVLLACLLLGVANITTVVAFGWPAFESVNMLQLHPEQAAKVIQAAAMPLYWVVFSFILVLESFGVMGIIPFYVTLKAVALSFLWVGEGTQMLQRFVVKMGQQPPAAASTSATSPPPSPPQPMGSQKVIHRAVKTPVPAEHAASPTGGGGVADISHQLFPDEATRATLEALKKVD